MTNMPLKADILPDLPHRRMEAWKWTDVRAKVTDGQSGLSAAGSPLFTPPAGIHVGQGEGHKSDTPMGKLAARFAGLTWQAYVPEGTAPKEPLLIEGLGRGHVRFAIMVDKNASLTIVEHYRGDAGSFANLDMQIHLGEGAHLTRIVVHDDPADCTRVATCCIAAEEGANVDQFTLSTGGKLARLETRLYGEGKGIRAKINGAYLLDGDRHCDMTSHIDLQFRDSVVRQSVKGVVTDKARGVFQGKFHVHRAAQHTDAEMRHDALMLSDTSEVRAKPELEIYADDVACAHGNTIGQLDESALFYMRQRGIPAAQARALLTEAFVADVFDDMADEEMKNSLIAKVRSWLEAQS